MLKDMFQTFRKKWDDYWDRSFERRKQKLIYEFTPEKYRHLSQEEKDAITRDFNARFHAEYTTKIKPVLDNSLDDAIDMFLAFIAANEDEYYLANVEHRVMRHMGSAFVCYF